MTSSGRYAKASLLKPRLPIEIFAPMTNGQNLHHALPLSDWRTLRGRVIQEAGFRCEFCGASENERTLVCHERWKVDIRQRTQILVGLTSTCTLCHSAAHYGRPPGLKQDNFKGKVFKHLSAVNGWNKRETLSYLAHVRKLDSSFPHNRIFSVDCSYAKNFGVKPYPFYAHDVDEIVEAKPAKVELFAHAIAKFAKRHRVAVYRMNGIFIAGQILPRSCSRYEKERLLRALPKLAGRNRVYVGLYGKFSRVRDIASDLMRALPPNRAQAAQ